MSNSTAICPENTDNCTIATCSMQCAEVAYLPSLGGNVAYLVFFAIILVGQIGLGIFYRTWGFLVGMVFGLALEIAGYIGRVMLHDNPFEFNNFLIYLVCLTIGPAFLSASIYLCLSRIIIVYGQQYSRISPRVMSIMFMCFDFVSLILQAAGGAISASADTEDSSNLGRNIMIAGLAWQVVSLAIFMAIWGDYLWRMSRSGAESKNNSLHELRTSFRRFKWFQYALWLATILIFIRSVYRVIELQGGFDGAIANNEAGFMIFEGPMIIIATGVLTVLHPGFAFAGKWRDAAWSIRGGKGKKQEALYESIPPVEMK